MNDNWNAYCEFSGVGSHAWAPPFHLVLPPGMAADGAGPPGRPDRGGEPPPSRARAAAGADRSPGASPRSRGAPVGPTGSWRAENPGHRAARLLAGRPVRRLGGHRFLLPLPQLPGARRLLLEMGAQAVRPGGVGAVGAGRSGLRPATVPLDARARAHEDDHVQPGPPWWPVRLFRYPRGRAELRRQLLDPRFAAFAPEWG